MGIITQEEKDLMKALEIKGIRVEAQSPDGRKQVDLRVEAAELDIEVDGEHHLTNPRQILSDLDRSAGSYERAKFSTVHIPNWMVRKKLWKVAYALSLAIRIRIKKIKTRNAHQKAN
jgi:very-short-patch-repair endonuclease